MNFNDGKTPTFAAALAADAHLGGRRYSRILQASGTGSNLDGVKEDSGGGGVGSWGSVMVREAPRRAERETRAPKNQEGSGGGDRNTRWSEERHSGRKRLVLGSPARSVTDVFSSRAIKETEAERLALDPSDG